MEAKLERRVVTGFAMLFAFLVMLFLTSESVFALFLGVLTAISGWEWARLSGFTDERIRSAAAAVFGVIALYFLILAGSGEFLRWLMLTAALFWIGVVALFYLKPVRDIQVVPSIRLLLLGLFVCVSAVVAIQALRSHVAGHSSWLLLYAFVIVWSMDVGAYFSGKRFGHTTLAKQISPGKTREGVYGGLAAAFLMFIIAVVATWGDGLVLKLFVATLFAAVASVCGDLFESRLKRGVELKDSGTLLPGHGGLLDRLDGVSAAMPVFTFAWMWL